MVDWPWLPGKLRVRLWLINHYSGRDRHHSLSFWRPGCRRGAPGRVPPSPTGTPICKPDLCNFVCKIEQYCIILAICTIYKNSCNMYNMFNMIVNMVSKIACNIEQYCEQYYVQSWTTWIYSIILCAISRNILCNIKHKIARNIAQYCLILYITFLAILLTYCTIYSILYILHILHEFL